MERKGCLLDPTAEPLLKQLNEGNVQKEDTTLKSYKPPRLLTVSYSCAVIVLTWFVFGLTIGYTSPVISDLEGNGNSAAPLDKTSYQDLFNVCSEVNLMLCIVAKHCTCCVATKVILHYTLPQQVDHYTYASYIH